MLPPVTDCVVPTGHRMEHVNLAVTDHTISLRNRNHPGTPSLGGCTVVRSIHLAFLSELSPAPASATPIPAARANAQVGGSTTLSV